MDRISIIVARFMVRARKRDEFARHDPVEVSIFHALGVNLPHGVTHLEVLVLGKIKRAEIKKPMQERLKMDYGAQGYSNLMNAS